MHYEDSSKNKMFTIYIDLGYLEIQKDLFGAHVIMSYKRLKRRKEEQNRGKLTDDQIKYNKEEAASEC